MIEKDFVTEGLKRTRIDEYLEKELDRAGYGGMEIQVTPLGTMVVVYAERPGMVIGRGGKTVRAITQNLKNNYELENPQVEVKEVDIPELNPKIMAHKISAMLQRGMHFRRVAYSALRRIMGAGAQGVEVTISGKIRGSRSACAKFTDGYIKKCGEPSIKYVKQGFATAPLKPGVLGISVRIMPPDVVLPDKVDIIQPKVEEPVTTETAEAVEAPTEEITEGSVEILEEITEEAAEEAAEVPVEEPVKEDLKTKATEAKEAVEEKAEEVKDKATEAKTKATEVKKAVEEKAEEVKDKATEAKTKATEVKKAAEEKAEEVKDKASEAKEAVEEKAEEVKEKAAEAKEVVEEKAEEVKDKAAEAKEVVEEKAEEVKEKAAEVKEAAEEKAEEVKEKAAEAKKKASDKVADIKEEASEIKEKVEKS
ncbi:30S ribosomal protein S3 [Methanobacterium subterraneum]|uniref:Small ribosomal subunit protein uS3 n=1 Tax=Methanobacterium subterraneum TaxID=59277 RepID=A0A2H4VD88_9EURY|nr:30S ribosomal protein S3 [Methanobacterium subterraneum]